MTKQPTRIWQWTIGGEAGFGIMSSGLLFAKVCQRAGYTVFDYAEYPSLIRGGHNSYHVSFSTGPVASYHKQIDVLVALDRETINLHLADVHQNGVVVYDASDPTFDEFHPAKDERTWLALPLEDLARSVGGQKLLRNTVAVGASVAILGLNEAIVEPLLQAEFGGKGESVVQTNINVLQAGYKAVDIKPIISHHPPLAKQQRLYLTGNEALALGALMAGCQYYAAYPMTPASSILGFLAVHGPKYGMVVRHAEDEISVINGTIGAAYAGVRAMCATSGGGFALMTEAVGLAAMTEIGVVIVNAQRGGPSTGLPTWTEQADLDQVLGAGQGDMTKIILSASTVEDCATIIQEAFNLAETWQAPVIVLTDKMLAESHMTLGASLPQLPMVKNSAVNTPTLNVDGLFERYATDTANGVSGRTIPGQPDGMFLANSDEHNEVGHTIEDAPMRVAQMEKRWQKFEALAEMMPAQPRSGPSKSPLLIVTWGSTRGAVEDAVRILEVDGVHAEILTLTHLLPLATKDLRDGMRENRLKIIVEGNQSGQLEGHIRRQTGLTFDEHFRKSDGRPFDPEQLAKDIWSTFRSHASH